MENKEQNRDFKGVWIPKEIWLNHDLNPAEKCLLAEIDSLDNSEEKGCFASNEYLGKFIGISEGSCANLISSLKKRQHLVQVFFDGRNRGLRLHKNMKSKKELSQNNESRVNKNMKAEPTNLLKQGSQNNEHSNTSINTDKNTIINGEETPPTNESDFVGFEVSEKAEPENSNQKSSLEEKETKEKSSAKKENKESTRPKKRPILEVFPNVQDFVFSWQAQYQGEKYSQIDPEKLYRRISSYCKDTGTMYADYIGRVMVWYDEAKDKTPYHFDKQAQKTNLEILAGLYAGASDEPF